MKTALARRVQTSTPLRPLNRSVALLLLVWALPLAAHDAPSGGRPLTIGNYVQVSKRLVSRNGVEYTFMAHVTNRGPAVRGVACKVRLASNHDDGDKDRDDRDRRDDRDDDRDHDHGNRPIILDDRLSFGPVGARATVRSTDTFSFRIERNKRIDFGSFAWSCASQGNRPPSANAGPDQTVPVHSRVTLDGGASTDPDGDRLTFRWAFRARPAGSAAALDDPAALHPSFLADRAGEYEVALVVNDGGLDSPPDRVLISTRNSAPVAHAGPDQTVHPPETVTLDGSGSSDVDGDMLAYSWAFVSRPAGSLAALSDPGAIRPTFEADALGEYVLRLVTSDGAAESAPDTVIISTQNSAPTASAGPDRTVHAGSAATLDGSQSSDPDGDGLSYRWSITSKPSDSAAALDDVAAVTPTFTADRLGDYTLQLVVSDGFAEGAADTVTISTDNSAPVAEAGAGQSVVAGAPVHLDGSQSSDSDGDPLRFSWSLIARPPGSGAALYAADGERTTFTPDLGGTYVAQLVVGDGFADSAPDTTTVEARAPAAEITPARLDFGHQLVGVSGASRDVTAANTGNADLAITGLVLTGPQSGGFVLDAPALPIGVSPGASATVSLRCRPTSTGTLSATLAVIHDAPGSPTAVALECNGVRPSLQVGPAGLSFGDQAIGGASEPREVALFNDGLVPVDVLAIALLGPDAAHFSVTSAATPFTLAAGTGASVSVRFAPSTVDTKNASLSIVTTAVGSPHVVALSGVGLPPPGPTVSLSVAAVSFAEVIVGAPGPAGTLTIANTGATDFVLDGLSLSGPSAGDFRFDVTRAFPITLAPGATTVVTIGFTPAALGVRSAQLTISSNAAGSPHVVDLAGTGIQGIGLALVDTARVGVGRTAALRVTLTPPAPPGGVTVTLASDALGVLTVGPPDSVIIPEGESSAEATVNGLDVGSANVAATASPEGSHAAATLRVLVTLNLISTPTTLNVPLGRTTTLPVTVAPDPAPAGGVLITIVSSDPAVEVLTPVVVVPEGALSVNATVRGASLGSSVLTASHPNFAADATQAAVTAALNIVQSTVSFGPLFTPPTIRIDLTSGGGVVPAPSGLPVTLTSANPACAAAAPPADIAAGTTSTASTLTYGGTATLPCSTTVTASSGPLTTDTVSVTVIRTPDIQMLGLPFTVGAGLQSRGLPGSAGEALCCTARLGSASHGGVTVRIETADPALALVSAGGFTAGTPALEVFVPDGSTDVAFVVQGVAPAAAPVPITATATGFNNGVGHLTVAAGAIVLTPFAFSNPPGTTLTTLSFSTSILVSVGVPRPDNGGLRQLQQVRAGGGLTATLTAADVPPATGVGQLIRSGVVGTTLTLDIRAGEAQTSTLPNGIGFDPIAAGQSIVTGTIPGFTATTAASIEFTVTAPSPTMVGFPFEVGAGLMTARTVQLPADHGGVTLRLQSDNPSVALVSLDPTVPGTPSVEVFVPNDTRPTDVSVLVHGVSVSASPVAIRASAAGFTDGVGQVDVEQPGIEITSFSFPVLPSTTTSLSGNTAFHVEVGLIFLDTIFGETSVNVSQRVRPGAGPLAVTVTADNTPAGVAQLVVEGGATGPSVTVEIPANRSTSAVSGPGSVAFDPLAPGTSRLIAAAPGFLTTTAGRRTVVVTPPTLTIGGLPGRVGAGLQALCSARLSTRQHGGVTLHVESGLPAQALVSPDAVTAGAPSIDIVIPDGTDTATFFVQGLAASASAVPIRTSVGAPFNGVNSSVTVESPRIQLTPRSTPGGAPALPASITTLSPSVDFTVSIGIVNFSAPALIQQGVRGGTALAATVTATPFGIAQVVVNGGPSGSTVTVPFADGQSSSPLSGPGSLAFDPVTTGTVVVSATIPGFTPTSHGSNTVTVSTPGIQLVGLPATVGAGLQRSCCAAQLGATAHGGVTVRIASDNPAVALVAPDAVTPATAAFDTFVPDGSTDVGFVVAGFEGATPLPVTTTITASAPGFTDGTGSVTVTRPALSLSAPTTVNTASASSGLVVTTGLPDAANTGLASIQAVRAGLTLTATLTLANTPAGAGQIVKDGVALGTTATVNIGPAQTSSPSSGAGSAAFDPIAPGTSVVSATMAGFISTTTATRTVTINPSALTVFGFPATVGAGLQSPCCRARLSGPDHGGTTVRVESGDPAVALVAPDATTAGSSSFEAVVPIGSTDLTFVVQGVEGASGLSATVTASVTGVGSATGAVNVVAPALDIVGLPTTTSPGTDTAFRLRVGIPASGGTSVSSQAVRAGGTGVTATITALNTPEGASDLSVEGGATGTTVKATLAPGQGQGITPTSGVGTLSFRPLAAGSSTVSASIPGFLATSFATRSVSISP